MVADSFSNFLQFWSWNPRTVKLDGGFIKASLLFCLPILVLMTIPIPVPATLAVPGDTS
jgi:hypothetical protein